MPKPSLHTLIWSAENQRYELHTQGHLQQHFGREDVQQWSAWLAAQSSFSFQGQSGRLRVVKEARPRGSGYWYAYFYSGQHARKRYLGRTPDLTFARLEEVARLLANESFPAQYTQQSDSNHSSRSEQVERSSWLPLLQSRLSPPHLPLSLVERSRLLARLDASLMHRSTLLQAPAGFGKTTLVNQWIVARRRQGKSPAVAWVSLDASDNDPVRFWYAIIKACQTLQPHLGRDALNLLSRPVQPPFEPPPLETVLSLLLSDLVQQVPDGLLILDDYHLIEGPRIHETMAFFIDHLPTTLRVLLLSRSEPPLPLLRWRTRGELYELHPVDLRFTPEETSAFLQQALPMLPDPFSAPLLQQLDASLEGWPAGLRLLSLTLQGRHMTPHAIEQYLLSLSKQPASSSLQRPLLDYFVAEILQAQPEPLQRFLLQTSVLSRLSGPLCATVTANEQSAELLATVERSGLFLEALDDIWYRYHALFAGALRKEASRHLGEDALHALSLRASLWYELHHMPFEAVEAAFFAGDVERAALLIEQADADGQFWGAQTILRWGEQIPDAVLRIHPSLCQSYAMALRFPPEREALTPLPSAVWARVEALFQMAEDLWRAQGALDRIGGVYALHALSILGVKPFSLVSQYAQQALDLLPSEGSDPSRQVGRGVCLSFVGMENMRKGRFGEAHQCFLEAYTLSLAGDDKRFTLQMLLLLGETSFALGELHQAAAYYRQALSNAHDLDDHVGSAQALLGLSGLSSEWNVLETAEQQMHAAMAHLRDTELEWNDRATLQLALLSHARGQTTIALQQLATLRAHLQTSSTPWSSWLLPPVLLWQARLHLTTGDLPAVQTNLDLLDRYSHTLELVPRIPIKILQARLLLAQGQPHEALLQLEHLLPIAQQHQGRYRSLEILLLHALTHAACKQGQQARQYLQQALSQAHSEGFLRLFLSEGEPLAHLLRQLLPSIHDKALQSYAQTILHAFPTSNDQAFSSDNLLFEPLSPQEQRVLSLLIAGRTNPQIARELVVSVNTVKHHIKQLYRKMGVNNRLEASEAARHLNLP